MPALKLLHNLCSVCAICQSGAYCLYSAAYWQKPLSNPCSGGGGGRGAGMWGERRMHSSSSAHGFLTYGSTDDVARMAPRQLCSSRALCRLLTSLQRSLKEHLPLRSHCR
jgi:hypothetical protein